MNAAILMMTTAWLAGANPPPPAPAAAGPVVSAPVAGCNGCGGGCGASCGDCGDTCCGSSSGWRERLGGLFHRHRGCGCETSCGCDTCGGFSGGHFAHSFGSSCGCDSCGSGLGLRERLGGLFHRHHGCGCETSCGCDTGCGSGCGGGCASCGGNGVVNPAPIPATNIPNAEPIPAPQAPAKRMPNTPPPAKRTGLDISPKTALTVEPESASPF